MLVSVVNDIFPLMKRVFESCVSWTTSLFDVIGAGGVVLSAFILVIIVSLVMVPLRGASLGGDILADITKTSVNKGKSSKGKK